MEGTNTNQTQYSDALNSLEAAMHGLSQRSKAISANIANINTPGYTRRQINFEETLQKNLDKAAINLNATKTDTVHINEEIIDLKDSISSELDLISPGNGINNVNIEREMLDLTKTGLRFKAVSSITKKHFEILRGIIRG